MSPRFYQIPPIPVVDPRDGATPSPRVTCEHTVGWLDTERQICAACLAMFEHDVGIKQLDYARSRVQHRTANPPVPRNLCSRTDAEIETDQARAAQRIASNFQPSTVSKPHD
jgi:hypothetical protein